MIRAEFSNGFVDVYKGRRAVKAAWMITEVETGKVLASGHSLTRLLAASTAASKVIYVSYRPDDPPYLSVPKGGWAHRGFVQHARNAALAVGWDGKGSPRQFWKASNEKAIAARRARCKIEIVDLVTI